MAFVRMSGAQLCARITACIRERVPAGSSQALTVVIDGKAAAGKSFLADYLAARLAEDGVEVCRIEADWFLESRAEREKREREGRREVSGHNYFPAELHRSFWKWEGLREAIRKAREVAATPSGGEFQLTGLYERKTGECTRQATIAIRPPCVIIVEGCYLLGEDLQPDVSILLYVNREIGRARKIQREEKKKEGEFPNVERVGVVITTWEQLEEPTFFWHLMQHGGKADVVVDTSDTESMSVVKFSLAGQKEDELQRALQWDQRVTAAEEGGRIEELRELADTAPAVGDYVRVLMRAGVLARGRLQFETALAAFTAVLTRAPATFEALTQQALMLERLGRIDEARDVLQAASAKLQTYARADGSGQSEVEGIRGRVAKQLWKTSWMTPNADAAERRRRALEGSSLLLEAMQTYETMFRRDPTSYYNGDNAAALANLYLHLTNGVPPPGRDPAVFARDRADLVSATRLAANSELLKQAKDFWATTTLGNLALLDNRGAEALGHYQRAVTSCDHDAFAVDSVAQQLEMFVALEYQPASCSAALELLNQYRGGR